MTSTQRAAGHIDDNSIEAADGATDVDATGAASAPPSAGPAVTSRSLHLVGATKRFGPQPVFAGIDLEVPNGSFTVLVGPSGCGKSTALRVLAGLETLDEGRAHLGDDDVTDRPPRERGLAMVFQDFALYPHMSVEQNITFGLRLAARRRRAGRRDAHGGNIVRGPEIDARCAEVMTMLDLQGLEHRRPHQLSGGQRQRVALGRAVIRRPAAFLMDEPLSNLDAQLRGHTRTELVRLHRRLGTTFLYVTHDQVEALSMATRLVVMDRGRIAQAGTPDEIHDRPATRHVATFIGSPPMNVVEVTAHQRGRGTAVDGPGLSGGLARNLPASRVTVGWRPGAARLVDPGGATPDDGLGATGVVDVVENLGDAVQATVLPTGSDEGPSWTVVLPRAERPVRGAPITLRVPADQVHCFDADSGARI